MTVLAADTWPSNAELIADVASLYFDDNAYILDATYGRGVWWKKWRPSFVVTNDVDEQVDAQYHHDFRYFPQYWENRFDVVAFDPPYVCVGGRETSGIEEMYQRFGLIHAPKTPFDTQLLINNGLRECARVTRPGGIVLCKCQDYISSGKLWQGTFWTVNAACSTTSLELVDRFEHIAKAPRPQPPGRRQVHARRNLSTLFVFRKG